MTEYAIVRSVRSEELDQIITLHMDALGEGSTLTRFGASALSAIYRSLLASDIAFLVLARQEARVVGFVLACTDRDQMLSALMRHEPEGLIAATALAIARRPKLLLKVLETALYQRRVALPTKAELLVIAVAPDRRSRGTGTQLIHALREELARRGISEYAVTIHRAMAGADRFYVKNGLRLDRRFWMYGVEWNAYVDAQVLSPARGRS